MHLPVAVSLYKRLNLPLPFLGSGATAKLTARNDSFGQN